MKAKSNLKTKLNIPVIETIILENGQIINWINNDKDGFVAKKKLKKMGSNHIIQYFLTAIKNFKIDNVKLFDNIDESKILSDLQLFASNIIHKKKEIDEKFFKENDLEYVYTMEKIKFILIYYYSSKEPLLTDFISFYYLVNEHNGLNSIKMIQNCINCKFKNSSLVTSNTLKSSFDKESLSFLYSNNTNKNSESELRQIVVKYSKPSELEPKKFFVFYEKPQLSNQLINNNNQTNTNTNTNTNFDYSSPNHPLYANKFRVSSKKLFVNADIKSNAELILNERNLEKRSTKRIFIESKIPEKGGILKLNENNKLDTEEDSKSFEKAFKYYLRKDNNLDPKILSHMVKIEENLILQSSDLLIKVLSNLAEKLIKYIERSKNMIILNAYFNFVRISNISGLEKDDYYAFQKCLLLQGIDKNEPTVIEKRNILKINMKNIISKRIPDDVNSYKNFEKFTKNDFCHGEFCHYIIPSLFKGVKEQYDKKYNFKIPKENLISTRNKNNELPEKIPLFEIKKVYDNPDLANLVLKAYSIFPPDFNKDAIIEKLVKKRNEINLKNGNNKLNKNEEEAKKPIKNLEEEYESIFDSYDKIYEKINEYENEFKQEIIIYTPTPGKFLHIDFNDMYTEKGVCKKCYKIYTLILEFLSNIDECTAEFKSLIKAKKFLIKGENLKINNYDDKNSNDNNLIIQEELGKTSIKKFLGIKILKLRMEELQKYQKREKSRIERNIVTQKKELNKIFNYNIHINLRLLLSNLLAEKTNNQFFNLLFGEINSDEDSILKHLDIKKPKITFEKTNLKDLRLQMGISSLTYNPIILNQKNSKKKEKRKSIAEKIIKDEKEIQKNQIMKNIKQQICQVDKNLFLEYNLLNDSFGNNDENNNDINKDEKKTKIKNKAEIIDEIFEYYRVPFESGIRNYSVGEKDNKYLNESSFILDEEENEKYIIRYNTLQNKEISILLKMHKIKNLARRKERRIHRETIRLLNVNQMKSLEEIKKQKEKQLEIFLKFDTKKYKKRHKKSKDNFNYMDDSFDESEKSSSVDASLDEDNYSNKNKLAESDSEKWDKDKVLLNSIYYNKKSKEFLDMNSIPYFYITTPMPKLRDFNSTQRINKNPLDILRRMDVEYFLSLGNFNEKENNNEKNKFNNINKVKFYSDDNFTSVPYEILTYNNASDFEQNRKKGSFKMNFNNIITSNRNIEDKKKYIVFVLNDFFDTYKKYKNVFKNIICKLKEQNSYENNNFKKKKSLHLKLNDTNELLNRIKRQRPSNNPYDKRPLPTHQVSKLEKMPNIYTHTTANNNNINRNSPKKTQKKEQKEQISELKFVLFNLPGQSMTLFTKKIIQNNIYYSDFLDRFIYFLFKEKEFDLSYKIILLGFGNGGQIALTYTSLYEKYWNIINSVILFNSYCRNGPIINEAMLEILKLVNKEKNPKTVEAFVKQNTRNPKECDIKDVIEHKNKNKKYGFGDDYIGKELIIKKRLETKDSRSSRKLTNRIINYIDNFERDDNDDMNENEKIENNMTLDGYKSITKGYFYNLPLNLKDISTKILCIHSNVDSFVNIHNISPLFNNDIPSYRVTPLKELLSGKNKIMGYDLSSFKNDENNKRRLIIFDGSHDVTYISKDKESIIFTTLISFFK